MVPAWENFRRFLWCWSSFCCCCCCFSFIFICRRFSFCWCCIFNRFPVYFAMSPALHLGFSDPWRFPPTLSSTLTTFDWLFIFIYRECYGFEWAFFTQGIFYLTLLPDILPQPAFIKVSQGAGSYFLESCRTSYWSSKHRPDRSVCLIHSNSQSFIHLKSIFMHVNCNCKSFTCGENFDKKI